MKGWVIALAVWFLLYGILSITNIVVENQRFIMGITAIIVALLIFFEGRFYSRPSP